jgi:hypothetical protein
MHSSFYYPTQCGDQNHVWQFFGCHSNGDQKSLVTKHVVIEPFLVAMRLGGILMKMKIFLCLNEQN